MSRTTHGMKHHPLYPTWDSMMQRCNNSNCTNYKNYGARGIQVSDEFKDCKVFIAYIQNLPNYSNSTDIQLDREDNNGNYERGNLRWRTRVEQNLNKRTRSDNTSGYQGISKAVNSSKWRAYLYKDKKQHDIGIFDTIEEAVEGRNQYIKKNKLSHKIQVYG